MKNPPNEQDLQLTRDILAGSVPAWHEFVERFSPVILAILKRYLKDPEELRTVFVDVLTDLFRGKLEKYSGQARLSTWLVFVARSAACDFLRRTYGRRGGYPALRQLTGRQREVFRLYYLDGLPFDVVRERAGDDQGPLGVEELTRTLARIEDCLGPRVLRRIAYDLHATSVGAASGRLLEYLDHASRVEVAGDRANPEQLLIRQEVEETIDTIRQVWQQLPDQEHRALSLRFDQGLTAREIATEMGLASQRQAFGLLDRAVLQVRRLLNLATLLFR